MKKTFKRTIACLLALLMVISSLPFTVFAEDNSVQPVVDDGVGVTCKWKNYGVFTNFNKGKRFSTGNYITAINDGHVDDFSIAYINFDISGIKASEYDNISALYEVRHEKYDELVPLQVMYPTKHQDLFDNQTIDGKGDKLNAEAFGAIWEKAGGFAQNAKDYFGLSKIGEFEYKQKGTYSYKIDVGEAVKHALKAGLDYATVVFIVAKDENGKLVDGVADSSWTDANIYLNNINYQRLTNVTVTESTTVQKPASLNENTANTVNADKEYNAQAYFGGVKIPDYKGNLIYCSKKAVSVQNTDYYLGKKMAAPANSVMVYTGVENATYMPVFAGFWATDKEGVYARQVILNWAGNPFKIGDWKGFKQVVLDVNTGLLKDQSADFSTVDRAETLGSVDTMPSNAEDVSGTLEYDTNNFSGDDSYWWNKMYYTGTGDKTNYYEKFSNPTFQYGHQYWYRNLGIGKKNFYKVNTDLAPASNIYVVNYKPIYDVLKNTETVSALGGSYTFKDLYKIVWGHESDFDSPAAVNRYYSAVEKLISIDPQAELANCADDQVESKVKELGVKIKTAYSRYVSAAQDLKYKLDWTAYNDADTLAATALNQDRAQYTEASITEFETIVNKVGPLADAARNQASTKQADIDNFTSQLLSALSMLRKKSITITIKIYKNGVLATEPSTQTVEYGTPLDINSGINPTTESVKGWVVRTDGKKTATKVDTIDSKFTLHATMDATVEAYVVPLGENNDPVQYSKVIFYGFNGRVIDVKYLKNNETLVKDNYTPAPTVPFYSFTSWSADSVTGNGKDIIVRANYSADTSAQQCNVHYERFAGGSKQYSYDQYVYLPDVQDGEYFALSTSKTATEDTILTYLNGREFHVPMVKDIYVVKVDAADRKAKVAVTGSYATKVNDAGEIASEPNYTKKRAVFNCKFYLPEGCEAIEWGAKISANNRTKVVKSDKNSKYNEYSIYMDVPKTSSIKGFTAVAYVTYKDSTGTYKTIESKVPVTQELN